MRLTAQPTSRPTPSIGDCPCCFGALEGVKLGMADVSRALTKPLPLSLQAQVEPALDAVRVAGRDVMAGLKGAFGRLSPMPDLASFRFAVADLDAAIAVATADVPAGERDILLGLRDALSGLSTALTTFALELDDAGHQAQRRAGPLFRCEPVADQQNFGEMSVMGDMAGRQVGARMAAGAGR